jgi:hypothetical protein
MIDDTVDPNMAYLDKLFDIFIRVRDNKDFTDDEVFKYMEIFKTHTCILDEVLEKNLISEDMLRYMFL